MFRSFCYDPVRFDVVLLASTRKLQDVFHSRSLKAITGEKKQGHQIIMSPVINYRQLHFRRFALGKRHETEYVYIYICILRKFHAIHHLNTRSPLKYSDFERFEILSARFCASRTTKKTSMWEYPAPPQQKNREKLSVYPSIHPSINQTYV